MKYNPQVHHRRSIRLKGYDYSQAGAYFITICCHNRLLRFGTIANAANGTDAQMILNEFGQVAYHEWAKLPERFPNVELDVFQIMPNHMHGIIVLTDPGATIAVALCNMGVDDGGIDEGKKNGDVGATLAVALCNMGVDNNGPDRTGTNGAGINRAGASPAPTAETATTTHGNNVHPLPKIGDIIGAYKSLVANGCMDLFAHPIETGAVPKYETMGKVWQRNYHEHIIRNERSYQIISDYIINNPKKWKEDKFFGIY